MNYFFAVSVLATQAIAAYHNITLSAENSGLYYMATMTIGENKGQVLVDINSPYLLIMETNCTTCTEQYAPFYTPDTSNYYFVPTDFDYTSYDLYNYETEGFVMNLWPVEDFWRLTPAVIDVHCQTCENIEIDNIETGLGAYNAAMVVTIRKINEGYWLPAGTNTDLMGGFLGIGQAPMTEDADGNWNTEHEYANNFWKTVYNYVDYPPTYEFYFAVYLRPDIDSYNFLPEQFWPNMENLNNQTSTMFFQNYQDAVPDFLVLDDTSSVTTDSNDTWSFKNNEMQFGVRNTSNGTCDDCISQWYDHYQTQYGYYESILSMAYPGIGLPTPLYTNFSTQISYVTNGTMVCDVDSPISGCYADNVACEDYFSDTTTMNLTDFNFRIGLDSGHLIMPLYSLMRNQAPEGETPYCQLLVYIINVDEPDSQQIVLGTPIFQNFFSEFTYTYRNGTENKVDFTTSPNAFPGVGIATIEYTEQECSPFEAWTCEVTPTPTPTPDVVPDVVPETDDSTSTGLNTTDIICIAAGGGCLFLALLILVICCVKRAAGSKPADNVVYTLDHNMLMKGQLDSEYILNTESNVNMSSTGVLDNESKTDF